MLKIKTLDYHAECLLVEDWVQIWESVTRAYSTNKEFFKNSCRTATLLKVTSAIKQRNTAEEIIIYTQVYSLLLKLEKSDD